MQFETFPVHSRLADPSEVEALGIATKLPSGMQLSRHQVDTFRALLDPNVDVILNTAMTGDGKSLAAYLPVLTDTQLHAFGMYPTNELLRDQGRQFADYLRAFGLDEKQVPCFPLWGAELTRLQEEYEFRSRGDFLKERFTNHNVLLTNPDIFNLVMNYRYARGSKVFSDQELPYSLCTNFDYFVFDEFHVFAIPQIMAALTAMLYTATLTELAHKFLFSSATMSDPLIEMLKRSGLRYVQVGGDYHSEAARDYRQILYPATLNIEKLEKEASAEVWVREHIKDLVKFWNSCTGHAKGAIIVNSVVAARRIARLLTAELGPHGISVGENTGLSDEEQRRVALEKNLVVGTSTIDVGVDFNINLLIFESTNAGTFLQRLGRLGRVKRNEPKFPHYQAHALISPKTPWVYYRLEENLSQRGVVSGSPVDRPTVLREAVNGAFPGENDFLSYAKRWGILQATHVVNVLENYRHQGAYASLARDLAQKYAALFQVKDFSQAQKRYWAVSKHEEHGAKLLDEVLGFRGSSPFQVACWDASIEPNAFLAYDLFPLLQSTECVVVDKEKYKQGLERRFARPADRRKAQDALKHTLGGESESPLILRIEQFNPERDTLVLKSNQDFVLCSDRVTVLNGFAVEEPRTLAAAEANSILKRQSVVCYITRRDPGELRRLLQLPAFFPLYLIRDQHRNKTYGVAFGKAALLLDSVILPSRKKSLEDEPIIL